MSRYGPALACATEAAQRAGELLRREFHHAGGPRGRGSHADIDPVAEQLIRGVLLGAFPDYGYLGEELGAGPEPRDPEGHLWLVDPNDATTAFLKGFRGASVSIALLREGEPVLGVVYAYAAPDDEGDLIAWAEGLGPLRRNGQEAPRQWPDRVGPECTVLLSHQADRKAAANARLVHPMRFRAVPSIAYRLALVAVGEGDAAVSLSRPVGWDYGAGHALLRGAGAELWSRQHEPVRYDRHGHSQCGGHCYGGAPAVVRELAGREWSTLQQAPRENGPWCWPAPERVVSDAGRLARAQGCLLGQCAGDALGSLVEFQSAEAIARCYPEGPRRLADGGSWDTIAGQPTDDSELALTLARSLTAAGLYQEEDTARAYAGWLESGPFDIGGTTRTALGPAAAAAQRGESAAAAAHRAATLDSQANGALMRVSPLGILGAGAGEEAAQSFARADAGLTHPHQVCRDANAVFVTALAFAIASGEGPEAVYRHALEAAERTAVLETLRNAAAGPPRDYLRQQGWVLIAFQNAFYQLLHAGGLEAGLVDTVRRGGDTDTNGAIAGALLGAVWGRGAVPHQWVDRVLSCRPLAGLDNVRQPRPPVYWPVDVLWLAERLLTLSEWR